MGKHTAKVKNASTSARARRPEVDAWPIGDDEAVHAIDDPDIGVDAASFYRWRRIRSEPPPPLGPSGSGLAYYRRRDG